MNISPQPVDTLQPSSSSPGHTSVAAQNTLSWDRFHLFVIVADHALKSLDGIPKSSSLSSDLYPLLDHTLVHSSMDTVDDDRDSSIADALVAGNFCAGTSWTDPFVVVGREYFHSPPPLQSSAAVSGTDELVTVDSVGNDGTGVIENDQEVAGVYNH